MVICQMCKGVHAHTETGHVFLNGNFSVYVCQPCFSSGVILANISALRECSECQGVNEFNEWCFTCEAEKMFWKKAVRVS